MAGIGADGFDRAVGAVAGGLRGKFGDEHRRHQRTRRRNERDRPRPREVGRAAHSTFDQGGGDVVIGQIAQQEPTGVFQRQVEDDRAEAGDDADHDAEQQPFVEVLEVADETAHPSTTVGSGAFCLQHRQRR